MFQFYRPQRFCSIFGFSLIFFLFLTVPCKALSPGEVLVVGNGNSEAGMRLAAYYMQKRGIPDKNLVKLSLTLNEVCSREEYEKQIAQPVRKHLKEAYPGYYIRCLVLMYGVPLKVAPPKSAGEEKEKMKKLKEERRQIKAQLKELSDTGSEQYKTLKNDLQGLTRKISVLEMSDRRASVDSELSLVLKEDYPLSGWQPNPLYVTNKDKMNFLEKLNVMMISRLDGPSESVVKRIVDDSLLAEQKGLNGTAYFDARWPESATKPASAYANYDRSIHRAAKRVKAGGRFAVVKQETDKLFQPGEGLEAALYCGWYSLGQYVDAFTWQPGSIGYHIASSECATLKKKGSRVWCKMMLEKGVAATLGPVNEPYIQAFPLPEVFFTILLEGSHSLVETYYLSLPYLSWKMVLIGDPLYRPFKEK